MDMCSIVAGLYLHVSGCGRGVQCWQLEVLRAAVSAAEGGRKKEYTVKSLTNLHITLVTCSCRYFSPKLQEY